MKTSPGCGTCCLLLLIDTAVDFRELPLTELQFLHAGLDVELWFCHQKLMPAERTGECAIHKNLIVAEIGKNAGSVCNAAAKHDCADNYAGEE